jgi:hypothetical protein
MKGIVFFIFSVSSIRSFVNNQLTMHIFTKIAAYKDADGLKLVGKRILVDVERGRTVKGWRPRRLGNNLSFYIVFVPDLFFFWNIC